jgi:hypothetical protein
MEKPYPEGHVAELQNKNQVVAIISTGRFEVIDEWAEKDFYVYEVRAEGGQKGFVFRGDEVKDLSLK